MTISPQLLAITSGLGIGLATIAAIGPQNAFVLRQGLRGEHVAPVVAICVVSDVVLIAVVVAGAGAILDAAPWAVDLIRWTGAAYLAGYGLLAARRALRPATLQTSMEDSGRLRPTVVTTLALTWLNPHVYVDTVLLLGPTAAAHGIHRWAFAAGAVLASTLWFIGIGTGARLLRPAFARPGTWHLLDGTVAVVMIALAVALVRGI
jgi:L-lysine exporter family protein LysE/ArgO